VPRRRIVAVGHGRGLSHDRLERNRHGVSCLWHGRDRKVGRFNRDEQLQPGDTLRIAPGNRGIVVMRETGSCMPAEMRVYADRAVMPVVAVIVVVQVRVEEGRTQRRQLEGGG
jgi:hypothetical protein